MKIFLIIVMVFTVSGWVIYNFMTPDYVKVNRQMVEQCSQDKGICD